MSDAEKFSDYAILIGIVALVSVGSPCQRVVGTRANGTLCSKLSHRPQKSVINISNSAQSIGSRLPISPASLPEP